VRRRGLPSTAQAGADALHRRSQAVVPLPARALPRRRRAGRRRPAASGETGTRSLRRLDERAVAFQDTADQMIRAGSATGGVDGAVRKRGGPAVTDWQRRRHVLTPARPARMPPNRCRVGPADHPTPDLPSNPKWQADTARPPPPVTRSPTRNSRRPPPPGDTSLADPPRPNRPSPASLPTTDASRPSPPAPPLVDPLLQGPSAVHTPQLR
jgi:hypothetical protein